MLTSRLAGPNIMERMKPVGIASDVDPYLEGATTPGRVTVFYLSLPAFVDIPEGTTFTEFLDEDIPQLASHEVRLTPEDEPYPPEEDTEGKAFVSLRFWQTEEPTLSDFGVVDVPSRVFERTLPKVAIGRVGPFRWLRRRVGAVVDRLRPPRETATVVEAVTVLTEGTDRVSHAFDRCLAALNDVVRSYRIAVRQPVRLPSRERLPFLVPYFTREAGLPFEWAGPFMFLLHYNVPREFPREEVPEDLMERLFNAFDAFKHGNPMLAFSEHGLEGQIALQHDGDYADAVIHAQTALEALFDNLLTLMLWEEGREAINAAEEEFIDVRLRARVQRNFPQRFGGNWDPRGSGPVGRWRKELAPLRNDVVHRAYIPSREEAEDAFRVASDVTTFVFERLVRDSQHRKSALLTVGLEGFETYGDGVTEELRALAASDEGDWLTSYSEWRSRFEETLAAR